MRTSRLARAGNSAIPCRGTRDFATPSYDGCADLWYFLNVALRGQVTWGDYALAAAGAIDAVRGLAFLITVDHGGLGSLRKVITDQMATLDVHLRGLGIQECCRAVRQGIEYRVTGATAASPPS